MTEAKIRRNDARLQEWRNRTVMPMVAAAAVFLAAYSWPIIDSDLPAVWESVCSAALVVVWALFCLDYVVRLWLAPYRWSFVRRNWFDLLVLLIPALRTLRLVQVIVVLGLLNKRATMTMRASVSRYSVAAAVLIVFCAAVAVLDAERGEPGAVIHAFPDALWWAATTVTTVGYGDLYPVTAEGRLVAGVLFTAGIALLGVVTATLASWFVEKFNEGQESAAATQKQMADLMEEVRSLRVELAARTAAVEPAHERSAGDPDPDR
ncbi:potassium channel family protein [Streptomonospora salina]|uniref:Voltage-gated potassium channel n=1 Tax=Streptomonospora salina TaxID=104205 RepID=A0A841EB04_9ACTN|nr:potassium channel family protein [Streptomonospora salina]MBB5998228.1 voltage-gated potassium channel [Streptomonospora salina]